MSADILKMSQTLPVTANELAAIAAAGGTDWTWFKRCKIYKSCN